MLIFAEISRVVEIKINIILRNNLLQGNNKDVFMALHKQFFFNLIILIIEDDYENEIMSL